MTDSIQPNSIQPNFGQPNLIQFLQSNLGVSADEITTAMRHQEHRTHLPIILWQYGFITLEQLDQIFNWLMLA